MWGGGERLGHHPAHRLLLVRLPPDAAGRGRRQDPDHAGRVHRRAGTDVTDAFRCTCGPCSARACRRPIGCGSTRWRRCWERRPTRPVRTCQATRCEFGGPTAWTAAGGVVELWMTRNGDERAATAWERVEAKLDRLARDQAEHGQSLARSTAGLPASRATGSGQRFCSRVCAIEVDRKLDRLRPSCWPHWAGRPASSCWRRRASTTSG